jgi:hypothetical protein
MHKTSQQITVDAFFPSYFARVPIEAMTIGSSGSKAMSHAEFRVFVALCRFRGIAKIVNPTRTTITKMTGMTPNNISRATRALQDKGWLAIQYEADDKRRKVINYELKLASFDAPPPIDRSAPDSVGPCNPGVEEFDHDQADAYEADDEDHYCCNEPAVNSLTAEELDDLLGIGEP